MRAALAAAALCAAAAAAAQQRPIAPAELRGGLEFASPELRAMQRDDLANPGMLWVERGARLFGAQCARCHDAGALRGAAARYPAIDPADGRLLNLEGRINRCRVERLQAAPLAWESDELLALTAFVAERSRGAPLEVSIEGPARPHFEAGRAAYYARRGQLNLACAHCHNDNWGKRIGPETISQGHPTGFPAYRLEWQSLGSLQRRLRACFFGVRAALPEHGAPLLLELELYLAWRAGGLPLEAPAVRR